MSAPGSLSAGRHSTAEGPSRSRGGGVGPHRLVSQHVPQAAAHARASRPPARPSDSDLRRPGCRWASVLARFSAPGARTRWSATRIDFDPWMLDVHQSHNSRMIWVPKAEQDCGNWRFCASLSSRTVLCCVAIFTGSVAEIRVPRDFISGLLSDVLVRLYSRLQTRIFMRRCLFGCDLLGWFG